MSDREINHYFKQVVSGAPPEALAKLGQALQALQAERDGGAEAPDAPAAPKLRAALLALSRALLHHSRGELSAAQQLFLFSGALGDQVELSLPGGGKQRIELLPRETYEALLIEFELLLKASRRLRRQRYAAGGTTIAPPAETDPDADERALEAHAHVLLDLPSVLMPLQRLWLLANSELEPYDPERGAKAGGSAAMRGRTRDLTAERHELEHSVSQLRLSQTQLSAAARGLVELLRAERLAPALKEIGELNRLAGELLAASQVDYGALAQFELSAGQLEAGGMELRRLQYDLKSCFDGLNADAHQLRSHMLAARQQAFAISSALNNQGAPVYDGGEVSLNGEALARVLSDCESMHRSAEASLVAEHRASLQGSGVLTYEQLSRLENPLRDCFATPWNVANALLKLDSLHPNCFPHDAEGWPQLPPIIIVPGVGISRWLDDRFLLGFVAAEAPRVGPSLSLTPLDQAVLRLFGQFLARGDVFNYRGERVSDSFMAEYASEIEQKAVRKFTGQEKKLTIVGTQNEKDGASREDAVKDYCDFIFAVYNGQPIPKRISPRKIGVLLKYCVIGSEEQTATLALRLLPREQVSQVRETLMKLAGRDRGRLVELFKHALDNDPQVRSRFRGDLQAALQEVLVREVLDEINDLGLLGRAPAQPSGPGAAGAKEVVPVRSNEPHNYFDL